MGNVEAGQVVGSEAEGERGAEGERIAPAESESRGVTESVAATDSETVMDEVLERLGDFRAAGVKTVFVAIDSPGGRLWAGVAIYRALRDFSEAGGRVITFTCREASSAATLVFLAGDRRLVGPYSRLGVHSARRERRVTGFGNQAVLQIYVERTKTPRADLVRWLSCRENDRGAPEWATLTAEAAILHEWANEYVQYRQAWDLDAATGLRRYLGCDGEIGVIEVRGRLVFRPEVDAPPERDAPADPARSDQPRPHPRGTRTVLVVSPARQPNVDTRESPVEG